MKFHEFATDEYGAVTIDWTVLTAAIVGIGVASAAAVRGGVTSLGTGIDTSLSGATVAQLGDFGNFVYTLRYFSESQFETGINDYAQLSEAHLETMYESFLTAYSSYLDTGNAHFSGMYLVTCHEIFPPLGIRVRPNVI